MKDLKDIGVLDGSCLNWQDGYQLLSDQFGSAKASQYLSDNVKNDDLKITFLMERTDPN